MPFSFPRKSGRHPQRLAMFEELSKRIPSRDSRTSNAIQGLVGAYRQLTDTIERLNRDESSTPGARLVKMAKEARAKISPLMESLDSALNGVAEAQAHLRGEVEKAYNPPGKSYETVLRHQEIRALFRKTPTAKALQMVEQARAAGDEDTLMALASCQAYLSGLPNEIHQHTRDKMIEAHAPEQAQALKGLAEQTELVGLFRSELAQSVADLIDFHKADSIIEAARVDVAE